MVSLRLLLIIQCCSDVVPVAIDQNKRSQEISVCGCNYSASTMSKQKNVRNLMPLNVVIQNCDKSACVVSGFDKNVYSTLHSIQG